MPEYDPSTATVYTPPEGFTETHKFVYVDGFSFSCLYRNNGEQLGSMVLV